MQHSFYRATFAWLSIALFYIYQYILQSVLSVIRPEIQFHFAANSEQFGMLSAAFLYAYAAIQIPAGMSLDKYGPRYVLTLAVLCCSMGCYLFASTSSYNVALAARALLGASSAFAFLGSLSVVSMLFSRQYYAFMAGVTIFAGTFGAGLAQRQSAMWVELLGKWQTLFHVFTGIGVFIAVLVFLAVPGRSCSQNQQQVSLSSLSTQLFKIILSPYAWAIGIYASLVYMPSIALAETWGYGFLIEGYQIPADQAYQIVPKIFFGLAIGGPIFGYLETPFWTPFLILFSNASMVVLLWLIATPSMATSFSVVTWSGVFFMIGFMACGLIFAYSKIKESQPPESVSTATGFIHGINAVCWAMSQQFMGRILDTQILINQRAIPIQEDYLAAIAVLLYGAVICLPFGFVIAFFRATKKNY